MRIGVFGGTFDPVHYGHLAVAMGAMEGLGLSEVIFIPAGRPWMKSGMRLSEGRHRLRMLGLAVSGMAGFRVDDVELRRDGLTYTVDTLRELVCDYGPEDDLFLILGADSYASFELWKEPGDVLRMSTLAVASRPGGPQPNLEKLESILGGGAGRGVMVNVDQMDISSSAIRGSVREGMPITGQVPPGVENYIYEHRLYTDEGGT